MPDRSGQQGAGVNAHIVPQQRFRDSFKIAGTMCARCYPSSLVLLALETSFKQSGVGSVDTLMSQLCGANNVSAAEAVLRQQLNLQVFVPIALDLLGRYEQYDPQGLGANVSESLRYGDLVPANNISAAVEAFVQREVQKAGGGSDFKLREVPITFNLAQVHQALLSGRFNILQGVDRAV